MLERPDRQVPWVRVVARLRRGVTLPWARAAAQASYIESVLGMPNLSPSTRQLWLRGRVELEPAGRGFSASRRSFAQPLAILMMVTGLVLVVACANLANLLLARAAGRRREMAIRLAIGGTRLRIARQLATESLVLAAAGGAVGLGLARWGTGALVRFAGSGLVPFALEPGIDRRALAFTAGLCLLTALLFGLAPSWHSLHPRAVEGRRPAAPALIVVEVALSLVILIAAGLFVRTVTNLKAQPLGFGDRLLLVWTAPEQAGLRGRPVDDQIDQSLLPERLMALLASLFGAAAVTLAAIGVYGVLSYWAARRTAEIGMRIALGATPGNVLAMVLRESLWLVAAGVAVGIPAALALNRLVAARLFAVGASDPPTIAAAAALVLAVGLAAGLLPACRASRVDPLVALRHE